MNGFKNWFAVLCLVGTLLLGSGHTPASGAENGTFSGRVVDIAHNPVSEVEVFVYHTTNIRRPADFISPPTQENGEFRITLPAGTYWAVARLRHGKERFGPLQPGDKHSGQPLEINIDPGGNDEEEFIVADLEETSQLSVKFDTSFIQIKGMVLTAKGLPVKNAYAFANRRNHKKKIPDYISVWTDKTGNYTLFMPPGIYYFGVAHLFPPKSESTPFQKVTIDSTTKNINIVIRK